MSLFLVIQNEDCHFVIRMLLSCILHDNQNCLQLDTSSHRIWLQVLSVVILNTFFNWSNWWWNFIRPEGFWEILPFCILVSGRYNGKYMSGILCFSESNVQFRMYFLCTEQKEKGSACVLFMGTALAESPREHPWLMLVHAVSSRCDNQPTLRINEW